MSKPRKTAEERLAEAEVAKTRAELDVLAERAAAAGMSSRVVHAIRRAFDVFDLLGWTIVEMEDHVDHIKCQVEAAEAGVKERAAAKAGAT